MGECASVQERERERHLAPLFICFFLLLGLPCVNWASQEGCLVYLRSSLPSSDLPLFYFNRLFPSLTFSHHHFGLLFSILTIYLAPPSVGFSRQEYWNGLPFPSPGERPDPGFKTTSLISSLPLMPLKRQRRS